MRKTPLSIFDLQHPYSKPVRYASSLGCGVAAAVLVGFGLWYAAPESTRDKLDHHISVFRGVDRQTTASVSYRYARPDDYNLGLRASLKGLPPFVDPLLDDAVRLARSFLAEFHEKLLEWNDAEFWIKAALGGGGIKDAVWYKVKAPLSGGYVVIPDTVAPASRLIENDATLHITAEDILDWRIERRGLVYGSYTSRISSRQSQDETKPDHLALFRDL